MIMFFVLLYILSGCKPLHYVLYHTGLKISTFLDIYFQFTPTPVLLGIQAIEGRMITDFVHKMLKGEHFGACFPLLWWTSEQQQQSSLRFPITNIMPCKAAPPWLNVSLPPRCFTEFVPQIYFSCCLLSCSQIYHT